MLGKCCRDILRLTNDSISWTRFYCDLRNIHKQRVLQPYLSDAKTISFWGVSVITTIEGKLKRVVWRLYKRFSVLHCKKKCQWGFLTKSYRPPRTPGLLWGVSAQLEIIPRISWIYTHEMCCQKISSADIFYIMFDLPLWFCLTEPDEEMTMYFSSVFSLLSVAILWERPQIAD